MQTLPSPFPDIQRLRDALTSVLNCNELTAGQVTILNREPAINASTYPSEIVTCRLADERELRLLCKYAIGHNHNCYGHRGGVGYEAEVYRSVLQPLQTSIPNFYGAHIDIETNNTWLILEYLDESVRVHESVEPDAMNRAARWIGRFHAANESVLRNASLSFLNIYGAEYYLGWAYRTSLFAGHLHERFPWLEVLCGRFKDEAALLAAQPPTIIHGEYYPKNVLIHGEMIYPVDWESAAIAPGEIDLASLTEGWPAEIARGCEIEYQKARWPAGAPASFGQTLSLARVYLLFRWLGDRPEWTKEPYALWHFELLHAEGDRLGLI